MSTKQLQAEIDRGINALQKARVIAAGTSCHRCPLFQPS